MDRIPADEWLLKEIPHDQAPIAILVPSQHIPMPEAQQRFHQLLSDRLPLHQRRFYLSVACLPFSLAFGLVPGPNVPLFYNLFRLYSHHKAWKGCERLCRLRDTQAIQWTPDPWLDAQVTENIKMNAATWPDATLIQIQGHFDLPAYFPHEVRRWQIQLTHVHRKQD